MVKCIPVLSLWHCWCWEERGVCVGSGVEVDGGDVPNWGVWLDKF